MSVSILVLISGLVAKSAFMPLAPTGTLPLLSMKLCLDFLVFSFKLFPGPSNVIYLEHVVIVTTSSTLVGIRHPKKKMGVVYALVYFFPIRGRLGPTPLPQPAR